MLNATAHSIQRQRVLKARVALALYSEYGYVPKEEEVEHVYHLARVLYEAILVAHFVGRQQKQSR
jgi:hypothetical protein